MRFSLGGDSRGLRRRAAAPIRLPRQRSDRRRPPPRLEACACPITPATTLWRELRDEVRQHYRGGRVIVAVDGIDGAGKTVFADGARRGLRRGRLGGVPRVDRRLPSPARRALRARPHARPRASTATRSTTRPSAACSSTRSATARRPSATTGFQLAAFDLARDTPVESAWVTAPRDAVLIVDGIFLHRPELRGLWNWSVWLDVPDRRRLRSGMALRDGTDPTPSRRRTRATATGRSSTSGGAIRAPRRPRSSTTPTSRTRAASSRTSADGRRPASCSSTSRAG